MQGKAAERQRTCKERHRKGSGGARKGIGKLVVPNLLSAAAPRKPRKAKAVSRTRKQRKQSVKQNTRGKGTPGSRARKGSVFAVAAAEGRGFLPQHPSAAAAAAAAASAAAAAAAAAVASAPGERAQSHQRRRLKRTQTRCLTGGCICGGVSPGLSSRERAGGTAAGILRAAVDRGWGRQQAVGWSRRRQRRPV